MTISEQKYQELKDERVAHFADKTKIKLILSLRTHRGTLTKILGLMEGCTASVCITITEGSRGARGPHRQGRGENG